MPNAFAHIELTTENLKDAQKFYGKVFDWKLSDVPGMPYVMIDVTNGVGGGMQSKPMPDAPTGWMPYVQVDSVKKTIAKAAKAGARVLLDYHDIGNMGAIGVFADPQGSTIGVWEAKEAPPAPAPAPAKKAAKKTPKKAAKKVAKKAAPKAAKKAAPAKTKPAKKATKATKK